MGSATASVAPVGAPPTGPQRPTANQTVLRFQPGSLRQEDTVLPNQLHRSGQDRGFTNSVYLGFRRVMKWKCTFFSRAIIFFQLDPAFINCSGTVGSGAKHFISGGRFMNKVILAAFDHGQIPTIACI